MLRLPTAIAAALALSLLISAPAANADETWSSTFGRLVYEEDNGPLALLSYPSGEGYASGHVILEGLAGNISNRGLSVGMWFSNGGAGEPVCSYAVYSPYTGLPVWTWGRVAFQFTSPNWADSHFIGLYGYCGEDPELEWNGTHN